MIQRDKDDLRAMRGILFSIVVSVMLWGVLILLFRIIFYH